MSIDRLLELPLEEGARTRALELLEAIHAERPRLDRPEDAEAVHDIRVALRRLRSLLKVYGPYLGKRIAKLRRQLGSVADQTGPARDAEVQLRWLLAQQPSAAASERAALSWLSGRLEDIRQHGYEAVRNQAAAELDRLLAKGRPRLARFERDLALEAGAPTFGIATGKLLLDEAAELGRILDEIAGAPDAMRAHRARIVGKRIRYLIEPLAESDALGARTQSAISALKQLQNTLGELHDAHLLGHMVQQAAIAIAGERAGTLTAAVLEGTPVVRTRDLRPGLLALAGRVRTWRDGLYLVLHKERSSVDALLEALCALAQELLGPPAGIEIERKYLLRAMPKLEGAELVVIEQGYIPGQRLRERLRRTRDASGERFFRTMKLGSGLRRIEVEEECSLELFDRMWPLTEGRRIVKTRHRVSHGGLVWEIDHFDDRELVLAEIELPSETVVAPPPPWLAEWIVRDVTDEPAFTNAAIAEVAPPKAKAARKRRVTKP